MEIASLEYELAPKIGTPLGVRKTELDGARFVAVRNIAHLVYKRPDGEPLMTYQETLDNREAVKNTILQHEMNCTFQGQPLVVNDGTPLLSTQPPPASPPQEAMTTGNGAPNGVPMQPAPMYAAPAQPASAAQAGAVPMQAYPPGYAPPPQAMAPGQMQMPGMQPPQAPPQEAAPAAGGRKRRNAGAAVAPPPPPPPQAGPAYGAPPQAYTPPAPAAAAPAPQAWQPPGAPQAYAPPPQAAPAPQAFAPQAAPAPQFYAPPAAPQAAPPAAYAPPQAAAPQGASVDLTPVLQRLDSVGKGLEVASRNGDEALKAVAALSAQLQATQALAMQALAALHHLYLSVQNAQGQPLLANATEGKANDFAGFQNYLARFIPQSPK